VTFVWLAVALAFAVAEMLTLAFYAVFLVIGGVAAAIAALVGVPPVGQIIVFCLVSIAGVLAARPSLMGYLKRGHPDEVKSGAQAMVGLEAPVIEAIRGAHEPGHVRVADGSSIAEGSTVRIDGLLQATLVVSMVRGPGQIPEPPAPAEPAPTTTTADTATEG
jgi:membrane protein implicated in regulation of membrane protease activity